MAGSRTTAEVGIGGAVAWGATAEGTSVGKGVEVGERRVGVGVRSMMVRGVDGVAVATHKARKISGRRHIPTVVLIASISIFSFLFYAKHNSSNPVFGSILLSW